MTNTKIEISEDIEIIESYVRGLIAKFPKFKWTDDNTLVFLEDKKQIGKLILNDKSLKAEGSCILSELKIMIKKKEELEAKRITEVKAKASVFKTAFATRTDYNGLVDNPDLFNSLSKDLSKLGIKEVRVRNSVSKTESVQDELCVFIDSSHETDIYDTKDGFFSRLRTALYEKVENDVSSAERIVIRSDGWMKIYKDEDVQQLKIKGTYVGNYYKERNIIQFFFNPFMLKKIMPLQEDYTEALTLILKVIKEAKIKKVSTESFKQQLFVRSFLANSEKRLKSIHRAKKEDERRIADYERSIQQLIMSLGQYNSELEYIETNLSLNGKGLYEELEEAKKLPFVTSINVGTENIEITFRKTCLTMSAFKRNGISFGKKTIYMSPITYKITPGTFRLKTDDLFQRPGNDNAHPHSSFNSDGWDSPCMGSGAGRDKIYEMLAANKFSEMAKLLWFWIKTFRSAEAHIHNPTVYDSRLADGLPVWDDKGKRIEINDPALIESGEQIELEKNDCYEANIVKFKTEQIC